LGPHEFAASENIADEKSCPEAPLEEADREEELRAALKRAEDQLEELSLVHAEKERQLVNRLGEELGRHISSAIDRAFGSALVMLEESLCQALLPFLGEQARMRALSDLRDLLVQELQQAEAPVLEIRAPAELHEALSVLRNHAGVSLTATECKTIEIVLVTERKRFEELSSRWLEVIQGRE
jgi:hypothetical protein